MKETGLAQARSLYQNRDQRARELKAEGRPVVGYLCNFAPIEIFEAAGLVPVRLRGDTRERVTAADQYLEPYGCPFVRNTFEMALKGRYSYIDGLVMSHACDSVQRVYGIWTHHRPTAFTYLFNVPHTVSPASEQFYIDELQRFKAKVEEFVGRKIDDDMLRAAIEQCDRNRKLLGELYAMRQANPPLISGTEMLEVLIAGTGLPAAEFEVLLHEVTTEVRGRQNGPGAKAARLMFYGCINDDVTLASLIEDCSAHLVMDDTCIGVRGMLGSVGDGEQMQQSLMRYYFRDFQCPRTFRNSDIKRFDYLIDAARNWNAQGLILYVLSFCDPHKLDLVDIRRHLDAHGLPSLLLEDDYSLGNIESMRTRIEAFVETLAP